MGEPEYIRVSAATPIFPKVVLQIIFLQLSFNLSPTTDWKQNRMMSIL